MNIKLTIIFLFVIVQANWAQIADFEIRNLSNQLSGASELIEKTAYEKIFDDSETYIESTPISEETLNKIHPTLFQLKDSCYSFRAIANHEIGRGMPELKACKYLLKEKEYSNYEFKGVYFENALIEITEYEGWGFLSVDLKNGLTCYTMGIPLTSNGETAISYSNYYGDDEIALTHLKTKKQYVISIVGWRTIESKALENTYYLKLEPYQTDHKNEIKYLKVEIKS